MHLTPLFYAVIAGRKDLVAALLERGADLHACCKAANPKFNMVKGATIFSAACSYTDDPQLVQLLIRHGANPRAHTDPGHKLHSLHVAISGANCKVMKCLLEYDPELINIRNADGNLPLEMAAGFGKLDLSLGQ